MSKKENVREDRGEIGDECIFKCAVGKKSTITVSIKVTDNLFPIKEELIIVPHRGHNEVRVHKAH